MGALPAALGLAAVGVNYMLESWYSFFPLNLGARAIGSASIGVLLLLTIYQGYVQYFVAWANAPETYEAYSEDSTALAAYYNSHPFSGIRYAATGEYSLVPVEYLTHGRTSYTRVDPKLINQLPLEPNQAKEFSVFKHDKETALKDLKLKYPKGRISPHYSSYSGKELFVIYTVPAS